LTDRRCRPCPAYAVGTVAFIGKSPAPVAAVPPRPPGACLSAVRHCVAEVCRKGESSAHTAVRAMQEWPAARHRHDDAEAAAEGRLVQQATTIRHDRKDWRSRWRFVTGGAQLLGSLLRRWPLRVCRTGCAASCSGAICGWRGAGATDHGVSHHPQATGVPEDRALSCADGRGMRCRHKSLAGVPV
jgi:hypothetical protein